MAAKSNGKVVGSHDSFYARWRVAGGVAPWLREEGGLPPERLLQAVWFHQRLLRDELRTIDGRPLRVLHPGFWNYEGGPDFRGAMIEAGEGGVVTGDVEVDVEPGAWHGHGHDRNPAFARVVLHVIWDGEARSSAPTLRLRPYLDSALGELGTWLGTESAIEFPRALRGSCCAPLAELREAELEGLVRQAALIRFRSKASRLQARARQAGWDQALWEGLFRALGYKQNVWPMQRLAELRGRMFSAGGGDSVRLWQARLLGVGGLLPGEWNWARPTVDRYLRELWDYWWRERGDLSDLVFPPGLWSFGASRPANHPHRRLALAAHWMADGGLTRRLEAWSGTPVGDGRLPASLLEVLRVGEDSFWSWRWTLRTRRLARVQPLLGATRLTDLAINVVLPWLWVRAREGRNEALACELERRYLAWPRAQDNAVLRLARRRLLGPKSGRARGGAARQQGLLQVVRDFCDRSDALCSNCRFPALVEEWRRAPR